MLKSGDSDGGKTSVYPEDRVDLCFSFLWDSSSLFASSPHHLFSGLYSCIKSQSVSYYLLVCCSNIAFNLQFMKRGSHTQPYLSESHIRISHLLQIPCGCSYQLHSGELVDLLPFVYFVESFSCIGPWLLNYLNQPGLDIDLTSLIFDYFSFGTVWSLFLFFPYIVDSMCHSSSTALIVHKTFLYCLPSRSLITIWCWSSVCTSNSS